MRASGDRPCSLVGSLVIEAVLEHARATPAGCFVEVGVYQGGTAWHLAELAILQHRPLYLYDTFCGIPYKGELDSHVIGDFKDTSAQAIRELIPTARVFEGVFPDSAVPMEPIAFCHLDCDQYQSYAEALEYLNSRMVPGGVIWCDDVPCLAGATQAVREFAHRAQRVLIDHRGAGKTFIQF